MSEGRSLYRIDDKGRERGCYSVSNFKELEMWNEKFWGAFWTVNEFEGQRLKVNVRRIISWAVDIDKGTSDAQLAKIKNAPLLPSDIIKTARGYHVYFDAIDGDPENYTEIVERLILYFDGDQNAKDLCRILRVPGYLHHKGDPVSIKAVHSSIVNYTEKEMREAFPLPKKIETESNQKNELRKALKIFGSDNLWERVWRLDCEDALKRISGTEASGMETIDFSRTSSGNLNILIGGKGTSCWIDKNKRIGSLDKGGPSIFQWINWYQKDSKKSYELLKKYFPEVM